jgi:hypothetical protein
MCLLMTRIDNNRLVVLCLFQTVGLAFLCATNGFLRKTGMALIF